MDVRIIHLTGKHSDGHFTIVDAADYGVLSRHSWNYAYAIGGYVMGSYFSHEPRPNGQPRLVGLHRFLLKPPPHLVVDHINSNPLDNRRCNLQVITQAENARKKIAHELSEYQRVEMLFAILRGEF